jgi:hypothetical protein
MSYVHLSSRMCTRDYVDCKLYSLNIFYSEGGSFVFLQSCGFHLHGVITKKTFSTNCQMQYISELLIVMTMHVIGRIMLCNFYSSIYRLICFTVTL